MDNPIVIAPTHGLAEYLCRQILEINPKKHAMGAQSAASHGLRGLQGPVVIMYLSDQSQLWKYNEYSEIEQNLRTCNALVIRIPEIQRINR